MTTELAPHVAKTGVKFAYTGSVPYMTPNGGWTPAPNFIWKLGLAFEYERPIAKHLVDVVAVDLALHYHDLDYEYNYFSKEYQQYTQQLVVNQEDWVEGNMPSLYDYLIYGHKIYSEAGGLTSFQNHDLNQKLNPRSGFYAIALSDFAALYDNPQNGYLTYHPYQDILGETYFDTWTADYKKMHTNFYLHNIEVPPQNQGDFSAFNVFFLSDDFYKTDPDNKRELFPFFTKLNFSIDTSANTHISDLLYTSGIQQNFANFLRSNKILAHHNMSTNPPLKQIEVSVESDQLNVDDDNNGKEYIYRADINSITRISTPVDFECGIQSGDGAQYMPFTETHQNCIPFDKFLEEYYSSIMSTTNSTCDMVTALLQYQNLVNFFEIFKDKYDKTGYTEHVIYRVDKFSQHGSSLSDDRILTSYWFFNKKDATEFTMYDTQVAYSKEYKYKCYAYILVQSTSIGENNFAWPGAAFTDAAEALLGNLQTWNAPVTEKASFFQLGVGPNPDYAGRTDSRDPWYLIEMPYFEETVSILHSPPCKPDVNIVAYRGVSDKILMMFNSNINQSIERPIQITSYDHLLISNQIHAQKAWGDRLSPYPDLNNYWQLRCDGYDNDDLFKNSILFETDDPMQYVQIFKTRQKPTEYRDFENAEMINHAVDNKYSTSYIDTIQPNTKYYYCFRIIDHHAGISNPTDLYEVEMFKEDETMYLIWRAVQFAPKILFDKKKSFRKYIKIQPAIDQVQIPPTNATFLTRSVDEPDEDAPPWAIASLNWYTGEMVSTNNHIEDEADVTLGTKDKKLYKGNKSFKFRFRSKNTSKAFDVDVDFSEQENFEIIDTDE